jgi:peptide/nickel transport system substrate-binding protein
VVDPVVSAFLNAACDKATGGWPCDKTMEELRDRFAREQDPAKRKAIAAEIQALAVGAGMYFPLGEWFNIGAYSTKVRGILATPAATVFWNMEKTAR